jgi:hypothetical protein
MMSARKESSSRRIRAIFFSLGLALARAERSRISVELRDGAHVHREAGELMFESRGMEGAVELVCWIDLGT